MYTVLNSANILVVLEEIVNKPYIFCKRTNLNEWMNVIVPDTHNAYASQAKTKILIKYKKPLPINPVPRQDGGGGGGVRGGGGWDIELF